MTSSQDVGSSGFSLPEVLVALALLSLVLTYSLPTIVRNASRLELVRQSDALVDFLKAARQSAIMRGAEARVVFEGEGRRVRESIHGRRYVADPSTDISFLGAGEKAGVGAPFIRFMPDGSASGGAVTLKRNGEVAAIRIDWLTGRIYVHTGSGGAADEPAE